MDPIAAGFDFGGKIIDVLKAFGIIPDKDTELKIKTQLADVTKQAQDWFLSYFNATIGLNEPWYSPSKLFRPVVSFAVVGFYMYAKATGIVLDTTDRILIGGIVGFWFSGRTIEKLLDKT